MPPKLCSRERMLAAIDHEPTRIGPLCVTLFRNLRTGDSETQSLPAVAGREDAKQGDRWWDPSPGLAEPLA